MCVSLLPRFPPYADIKRTANHDNNETHIDSESEQLRNAHGQLFRHHRRLLELVSPSKATGTLGASEGVASLNHDIIASRSAMGIMQPGVKDPSKDDDGDSNYEDARDFDLDAIAMNAQAYESGPADSSDASGDDSDADSESSQTSAEGGDEEEKDDGTAEDKVQRRKTLPSENKADEGGVFGVLKNSIGKVRSSAFLLRVACADGSRRI